MSELIGREAARFDGRDADYRGVDPLGDPKAASPCGRSGSTVR
jgi:hypothetical protein